MGFREEKNRDDVTLIQKASATMPADVADYAQVYIVSVGTLEDASAQSLVTYVKGGGHLYLTGDRPEATNDMTDLFTQEKILKPLII